MGRRGSRLRRFFRVSSCERRKGWEIGSFYVDRKKYVKPENMFFGGEVVNKDLGDVHSVWLIGLGPVLLLMVV